MLKQVQHDMERELLAGWYLLADIIRYLQDDKQRGLQVWERLLSRKHAVKWALIGVC
jgi:hypothetical protein